VNKVQELLHLTPVYEQVEAGWTQARIAEIPGVVTAAPTREEAQDMLLDALREFLLSFGPGEPNPAFAHSEGSLTLTANLSEPAA
jgi:predicted RNase H-like HicB family nuclease